MNVGPGLPSRLPPHPPNPILIPAYSLIVAGPASVAKSALLRLLLHTAPASSRPPSTPPLLPASDPHHPFPECHLDVLWHGDRLLLRLIDSPPLDFSPGAEDDLERAIRDIIHFVENRYVEGARDESTVGESHVHLCLYVLDPTTIGPRSPHSYRRHSPASPHSTSSATSPPANASSTTATITALPPTEIAAIRRLSARVNVLPILGRADAVPLARLAEIKHAVRRDLADAGLGFGIFDDGADAPTALDDSPPLPLLPYAVFAPDSFPPSLSPPPSPGPLPSDDDTRIAALQGRFLSRFRWGVLDALDPRNSDFVALRRATMNHHKVLKKYTKDYLYEKFKVDSILAVQQQQKSHQQASRVHPGSVHALLNHHSHHRHDHRDPPPPQSHLPPPPEHEYASRNGAGLSPPMHSAHASATRLPPVVYDRDDEEQRGVHRERDDVQQPQPREVSMPDETVTGRKRKIPMACSFCRSRKLKCDGVRPACAQCVKRSNKCDYQPHAAAHAHGGQTQTTTWKYKRAAAAATGANSHYPHHTPQAGERHHHTQEDVDELDEEGVSSASEGGGYPHHPQATAAAAAAAQQQHQQNYQAQGGQRKRVSVDMLIAATLDHPATAAAAAAAATTPPHSTTPATAAQWYEGGGAGGNGTGGMGVLDVGSEGDKKKRLNRQSANYGSKAVACVHCRARKTRCDAARPECGNCSRRSLACSYVHTQPSQPRSKGKKAAAAAAAAAVTTAATTNGTNTPATKLESTSPPATTFHHPHPHSHSHRASSIQQQQRSPPPGSTTPPAGTAAAAAKWAGNSPAVPLPSMAMSVAVPVAVDSALEESAERERPRSPPRAAARTPPEQQQQRARSLTPASATSAGVKRTRTVTPELGGGEGGPVEKRMKWDSSATASGDVGGGGVGVAVGVAEAVRV